MTKQEHTKDLFSRFPKHPIYKEHLGRLFDTFPDGATIFELGVNEMSDTFRLLDMLKSPTYYGFEPDPDHYKKAQQTANKYDLKINMINAAIASVSGKNTLYQSKLADGSNPGCSSIRRPKNVLMDFPHVLFPGEQEVNSFSLDDFTDTHNINHIHFIWADIQGAEIDMIRGGQKTLLKTDYLLTEYSNNELYDGQAKLQRLIGELPGQWEVVTDYLADVFVKRIK